MCARMQSFRALIQARPAPALSAALSPWLYLYKKLVMDNHRGVRCEAHGAMGDLGVAVGKQLAPHLKGLMGAWWLAQFDVHGEAAGLAQAALRVGDALRAAQPS